MPWLPLADDFDYSVFGMDPFAFHVHELLTAGLAIALTYHLLRKLRVHNSIAILAAVAFMVSNPFAVVTSAISSRHNLIGLVFMLSCLICYINYNNGQSNRIWYLISILFYFLAATAKEYYVPLPIVLFAITPGYLPRKLRKAWPYFLAAVIYAFYRLYMLQGFGGYNGPGDGLDIAAYLDPASWLSLLKTPFYTFNSLAATGLVLALALLSIVFLTEKRRFNWFLLIICTVALLVPSIGFIHFLKAGFVPGRWFLLYAFSFFVLIALGLSRIKTNSKRNLSVIVLIIVIPLSVWRAAVPIMQLNGLSDELAHRIWKAEDNNFYLTSAGAFKGISITEWIYLTYLVKGSPGTFIALDKDILHWLPQHGKHAYQLKYFSVPTAYPTVNISRMPHEKAKAILDQIRVKNGIMHLGMPIDNQQKYRIIILDRPFYVLIPYKKSFVNQVLWLFSLNWFHASGITDPRKARLVVGQLINGRWEYTQPVALTHFMKADTATGETQA